MRMQYSKCPKAFLIAVNVCTFGKTMTSITHLQAFYSRTDFKLTSHHVEIPVYGVFRAVFQITSYNETAFFSLAF